MKISNIIQSAEFEPAALGGNAVEVYTALYGDIGEEFYNTLVDSPQEIAVISRLLAHIDLIVSETSGIDKMEDKDGSQTFS